MSLDSVTGWVNCDGGCQDQVEIELIPMADGSWADDEEIELPAGWIRILSAGCNYEHYCPDCVKELGIEE